MPRLTPPVPQEEESNKISAEFSKIRGFKLKAAKARAGRRIEFLGIMDIAPPDGNIHLRGESSDDSEILGGAVRR